MAKLKMQRMRVVGLREDRKYVLEHLQRLGVVEPETIPDDEQLFHIDTTDQQSTLSEAIRIITDALEILDGYAPEKNGLLASFAARPVLSDAQYDDIIANRDKNLSVCRDISKRRRRIDELRAEIVRIRTRIDVLTPWFWLDVPMRFGGTETTTAIVGCIPGQHDEQHIRLELARRAPDLDELYIEAFSGDGDATCLFAVCMRDDREQMENALRGIGFSRPVELSKKPPHECAAELQGRIDDRQSEIDRLEEELRALGGKRRQLQYLLDYFHMRLEKYQTISRLGSSGSAFVLEGWTPECEFERVRTAMAEHGAYCERLDTRKTDDPPVVLKNDAFAEGAEPILAMYSLPSKRDLDPTPIMSFFYYILFGLMLGDAAYGLIMVAATLYVLLRLKPEGNSRKNMKLFCFSGVAAVIWGFVFGSFFGDLPNVIARTFFGATENILSPLWFDPISDPMTMMYFSVAFGVVHVLCGLVMGIVTALKNRDVTAALCDYASWLMMMISAIGWGLINLMGDSLPFTVPAYINTALLAVLAISVLTILFMSGRDSRSPVKRVLKGAYALYGVTSYLSDFLSYSRLLALGLATGVISQVVNQMATMSGNTPVGVVMTVVICLIGHTFNIGISLIGCYVHTCRLQYIEFFGKFYEGGGREYKPLAANTKFFKFKEEK